MKLLQLLPIGELDGALLEAIGPRLAQQFRVPWDVLAPAVRLELGEIGLSAALIDRNLEATRRAASPARAPPVRRALRAHQSQVAVRSPTPGGIRNGTSNGSTITRSPSGAGPSALANGAAITPETRAISAIDNFMPLG